AMSTKSKPLMAPRTTSSKIRNAPKMTSAQLSIALMTTSSGWRTGRERARKYGVRRPRSRRRPRSPGPKIANAGGGTVLQMRHELRLAHPVSRASHPRLPLRRTVLHRRRDDRRGLPPGVLGATAARRERPLLRARGGGAHRGIPSVLALPARGGARGARLERHREHGGACAAHDFGRRAG